MRLSTQSREAGLPRNRAPSRDGEELPDTDTLYIELSAEPIVETRDLDQDTLGEFDADGRLCAITVEHARRGGDALSFSFAEAG